MKNNDWFKHEKKGFFKDSPKTKSKDEFTPEKMMKTALTLPIVAGGILIGTKLLKELK